ncbi:probable RFC5 - DNA replication factor C, 40 KD subunit [Moesziomyces antarcticus]|uniref:Replication factor C subunit 5 n=1 Tax=Pseudozyma antarctica TaxID=84753 RepID=A0A5C3FJA0_PSEA2|nr:probable RFC5 - DNA replication factor C, 40 KD subunit [Moesziomyces antarcticus]
MLFVDKYRPKALSELHYHHDLSKRLSSLAGHEDFPHVLMYGPSGAGKKTRIACLLRELYGSGTYKLKIDQRVFVTPSNRKIDVNIVSSNYHIELTPSDAGIYDRLVIQDILKEIAQTQNVDLNAKHRFKVVVINEADSLSRDAQSALRRTMEKYMANLRLVLCATSTSKIIAPIRSRCLLLRVGAPSDDEASIHSAREGLFASTQICDDCNGNLRKAMLVLEALRMQSPDLSAGIGIAKPDWEIYITKTADLILSDPSPQNLLAVRSKLYELLVHAIPPTLILKHLTDNLVKKVDSQVRPAIVQKAAFYELRTRTGSKVIFHLEAFVAAVMHIQKSFLLGMGWDD